VHVVAAAAIADRDGVVERPVAPEEPDGSYTDSLVKTTQTTQPVSHWGINERAAPVRPAAVQAVPSAVSR
jgi:hypothetical protein